MAVGFGEPVGVGGSVGVADAVGAVVGFSPVFPEFVAAGCALAIDFLFDTLLFIIIVTTPIFLVFFLSFSFTVIFVFPAFYAVTTPFLFTETFLLEALNVYFAFFFFPFIVIFFFCPTVNVIFVFANFAFAKTSAENNGFRADAKSAKDKLKQRNVFFMFQNPLSFLLENTF